MASGDYNLRRQACTAVLQATAELLFGRPFGPAGAAPGLPAQAEELSLPRSLPMSALDLWPAPNIARN